MDETEVIYGIIGTVPMGEYDPDVKYELLNLVSYDGSSYTVHTDPPKGTPPTDLNYWQVSALGTSKATADSVGTVKPDGTTTEVSPDGSLSVKTAAQNALGLVKGSDGIKVGTDGSIDVNTIFTQATELANIIAEEAISSVLGKVSKAIAVTIGLNENALLKNMLTNMDANDQNKIPTSAYVHNLWERIGMGEDLEIGANLTAVVKEINSNLDKLPSKIAYGRVALNLLTSDLNVEKTFTIDISSYGFTATPMVFLTNNGAGYTDSHFSQIRFSQTNATQIQINVVAKGTNGDAATSFYNVQWMAIGD